MLTRLRKANVGPGHNPAGILVRTPGAPSLEVPQAPSKDHVASW